MTKKDEKIKKKLRKFCKGYDIDDELIDRLAHDFICDTHQTEAFLEYLEQIIKEEI